LLLVVEEVLETAAHLVEELMVVLEVVLEVLFLLRDIHFLLDHILLLLLVEVLAVRFKVQDLLVEILQ
jgi:hypothetical protein